MSESVTQTVTTRRCLNCGSIRHHTETYPAHPPISREDLETVLSGAKCLLELVDGGDGEKNGKLRAAIARVREGMK